MQLEMDSNQWDNDILGLVDINAYTGETAAATEDQNVDIEFEKQKPELAEKKEEVKEEEVARQSQSPISIVQTTLKSIQQK